MRGLACELTTDEPASGEAPVVVARGLRKTYGRVEAVAGIDLRVGPGEIVALLGPNGAGKTTAVELLEGLQPRTAGEVSVLGADPDHATRAWRDRLGIVLQESAPDPGLTVRESLALYAGYYAHPMDADTVLALVGLEAQAAAIATTLSGGQRRRLDFGLALIGDPALIFLDEPTTGFDPAARRAAWEVISRLRTLGKTILLTTHYMEEAEVLADRIAVMVRGRLVAQGSPGTLGGRDRAATTIAFALPTAATNQAAAALHAPLHASADGRVSVSTTQPLAELERLAQWSRNAETPITDLEVTRPSLEQIYLSLTGSTETEAT